MSRQLLVLNGPNLNLLGEREPGVYGRQSLADLEDNLRAAFPEVDFSFFQANGAGALIDRLHQAHATGVGGAVLNPGGLAHTSVALRAAAASVALPGVEVHLATGHAREDFRRRLVVAGACEGVVAGLGPRGYPLAVQHLVEHGSTGSTGARERG
jgi:3-dehydroquinate dehydratase-2